MDAGRDATREYLLESWLELNEAIDAHPELRKLLFDAVTGLPTTPLLFPRIRALLADRGEVSLLCLNVVRYSKIEEIYGWKVFDEVMRQVSQALENITGQYLRDSDIIAELMISGNSFVIVLSPPRNTLHVEADALAGPTWSDAEFNQWLASYTRPLDTQMQRVLRANQEAVDAELQMSGKAGQKAQFVSKLTAGIAVVLAFVISFVIVRSIAHSLKRLISGARAVAPRGRTPPAVRPCSSPPPPSSWPGAARLYYTRDSAVSRPDPMRPRSNRTRFSCSPRSRSPSPPARS